MPTLETAPNPAAAETAFSLTQTRIIHAPRARVYEAWTNPEILKLWFGPAGMQCPSAQLDARVGGAIRIHMRAPDGNVHPMKGEVREIVPPERLVFTNIAVDAAGNPIINGLTTVTFADEGGKTRLTLHTRGTALVDYAAAYLQGMEMGWTMSIDKLETLLKRAT